MALSMLNRLRARLTRPAPAPETPPMISPGLKADIEDDVLTLREIAHAPRSHVESRIRRSGKCIPFGEGVLLARVLGRYKLFLNPKDDAICGHLAVDGFWEFWNTNFLSRAVKPGLKIIEVGAHVGYFTTLLSDLTGPTGQVVAFEPLPGNADLLERSIAMNGYSGICRIDRRAVSGVAGRAQLHVPERNWGGGSIMGSNAHPLGHTYNVDVTTIDSWCEATGMVPDFLKIDAEGAEQAIWQGMARLRAKKTDLAVMLEFEPTRFADWRGWLASMEQEGMRLYRIGYEGLPVPFEIAAPLADGDLFEVLAVRGGFAAGLQ
jgi:FkbM family methyltransferase